MLRVPAQDCHAALADAGGPLLPQGGQPPVQFVGGLLPDQGEVALQVQFPLVGVGAQALELVGLGGEPGQGARGVGQRGGLVRLGGREGPEGLGGGAQSVGHGEVLGAGHPGVDLVAQARDAGAFLGGVAVRSGGELGRGDGAQAGDPHDRDVAPDVLAQQGAVLVDDRAPPAQVLVRFGHRDDQRLYLGAGAADEVHLGCGEGCGGVAHHHQDARLFGAGRREWGERRVEAAHPGGVDDDDVAHPAVADRDVGPGGHPVDRRVGDPSAVAGDPVREFGVGNGLGAVREPQGVGPRLHPVRRRPHGQRRHGGHLDPDRGGVAHADERVDQVTLAPLDLAHHHDGTDLRRPGGPQFDQVGHLVATVATQDLAHGAEEGAGAVGCRGHVDLRVSAVHVLPLPLPVRHHVSTPKSPVGAAPLLRFP